ncbi:GNAT family N-acetyltransferase [Pedobacter africanus]|uniref:Uncharacterized protein n=1 Tax=Pedobacter africanus TaxID=151894 RepID=A0ACC6L3Y8_9SPHI|nr:GNAT family N-acetyltransferase [Pedobacter africanus]MDR6786135.1 hypothetical protein [Pedobacter africanus]
MKKQTEECGNFRIAPILDKDKFSIMNWRNQQIDILRQATILTEADQSSYFKNVVEKLFEVDYPSQLLFGFYENDILVGYGGLVHINWEDQHAEISFLTESKRSKTQEVFINDWSVYLGMIEKIAFHQLDMMKIFTYSYDVRPHLNKVLHVSGYTLEARLKKHVNINGEWQDVLIHSKFKDEVKV